MTKRTTTEAELREWIAQGKTHKEIGQILGRHQATICAVCTTLGLRGERANRLAASRSSVKVPVMAYLAGLRSGMTISAVAVRYGVNAATVHNALKRAGLPTNARALLAAEAQSKHLQDSYLKVA